MKGDSAVSMGRMQEGRKWRRYRAGARMFRNPAAIVPIMNVLLLLFLFVVFNSSFVLRPGIRVQLPLGQFQQGARYGSATVILTRENLVFYDDERVKIDALAETLRASFAKRNVSELTIEADALVPYDSIVRVFNMASAAGASNICLAVRPTFGEESMP